MISSGSCSCHLFCVSKRSPLPSKRRRVSEYSPRLRVDLFELDLVRGYGLPVAIEDQETCTGCSLVNRTDKDLSSSRCRCRHDGLNGGDEGRQEYFWQQQQGMGGGALCGDIAAASTRSTPRVATVARLGVQRRDCIVTSHGGRDSMAGMLPSCFLWLAPDYS